MPVTKVLRKKAFVRGLLDGSRGWAILWATLTGVSLLRRLAQDKPEVVFRQELEPGGAFVIRNGERRATVIGDAEVKTKG
jgi:hypothetical protein